MSNIRDRKFFIKGEILPKTEDCIFFGSEVIDEFLYDEEKERKKRLIKELEKEEKDINDSVHYYHPSDLNSSNYFDYIKVKIDFYPISKNSIDYSYSARVEIEALLNIKKEYFFKDKSFDMFISAIKRFLIVRTAHEKDEYESISRVDLSVRNHEVIKYENGKMNIDVFFDIQDSSIIEFLVNTLTTTYDLNINRSKEMNEINELFKNPKYIKKKVLPLKIKTIERTFERNKSKNIFDHDYKITFENIDEKIPKSFEFKEGKKISINMKN